MRGTPSTLPETPRSTTIVVPCAGLGQRMGLPYPKELFCLDDHRPLLVRAITPFVEAISDLWPHAAQTVLLVAGRGRGVLLEWLFDAWPSHMPPGVRPILEPQLDEAGRLSSALSVTRTSTSMGDLNVLVLPDQLVGDESVPASISDLLKISWTDPAGGAVLTADASLATPPESEGFVQVGPDGVHGLAEKPEQVPSDSAVWVSFSARREHWLHLVENLAHAEDQRGFAVAVKGYPSGAPVVEATTYLNVGTWEKASQYHAWRGDPS